MRALLFPALLGSALLAACTINEVEIPANECTAPLRGDGPRRNVSFMNPESGQVSIFRRFSLNGSNWTFTQDTLLAVVGYFYDPEAFAFDEYVCREDYLTPGSQSSSPYTHVLQRMGGNLRPSGSMQVLPFEAYQGFELNPQVPFLAFQGIRPPEGLVPPLYGRIAGFTLGTRVFDTVTVRIEENGPFNYWIYSEKEGPLLAATLDRTGVIYGWVRAD